MSSFPEGAGEGYFAVLRLGHQVVPKESHLAGTLKDGVRESYARMSRACVWVTFL